MSGIVTAVSEVGAWLREWFEAANETSRRGDTRAGVVRDVVMIGGCHIRLVFYH